MQTTEVVFELPSDVKGEYPFLREDSFERKLRRYRRRQIDLLRHHPIYRAGEARAYLEQAEIEDALQRAELTARQRAICEYYLAGWNTYEIGRMLKTSRQAVCKALRLALSKVKAAWEASPYYGMAEVYCQEITRTCARSQHR